MKISVSEENTEKKNTEKSNILSHKVLRISICKVTVYNLNDHSSYAFWIGHVESYMQAPER